MDLIKIIKNNLGLFFVLATSILIVWPLFLPGYFSHHDDLQMMRVFEIKKCFLDLQIPCRWVSDMGYGNGYPLFNYYNPFPYYIGGLLSFIFGYIFSVKILFFIAAVLGGISMYFLAKELFGKEAAVLAAILYQFAPYRALDLYVRGALAESLAIAIVPFCFLFSYKLIKVKSFRYLLGLTLSLAALLMSHNIMAILFIPILLAITFFWLVSEKSKNISLLFLSFLLGWGVSAFYILPAYLEKDLVQIDNLTRLDLDFRAHFATINQLFIQRSWGYGASFPGPFDTISLQIGWPHWLIVFIASVFALLTFKKKTSRVALLFFVIFILAIFMIHNKSAFIWEQIGILRFAQFPWRFLAIAIFSASLLGGYLASKINSKYKIYVIVLLCLLTVFLNWQYFRPEKFFLETGDREKLSGQDWDKQQKAAILDYLPQGAVEPREPAPHSPILISGKAEINQFINKSNKWSFRAKVGEKAQVEVPVYDFPNWVVTANGKFMTHSNENYLGRISISLESGDYFIEGIFKNTLIRNIANSITIFSVLALILIVLYGKDRKLFS